MSDNLLIVLIALQTLSMVAIAIAVLVFLSRLTPLIKDIQSVVSRVKSAGEVAANDITTIRNFIRQEGARFGSIASFLFGMFAKKPASPRKAKKSSHTKGVSAESAKE